MTGTVTISLEDFKKLETSQAKTDERSKGIRQASKELEVFLSFLITRDSIAEYLDEFNRQSSTCRINIIDGRAKIIFTDEKN
tara:strand:- start:340 stop:585 length:246 start_codon:yes stop_codon:yes gene_type:complete